MGTSPEVLTNSWISVLSDIPNQREAIVNISPMKDWRFLPRNPLFLTLIGLTVKSLKTHIGNITDCEYCFVEVSVCLH